MDESPFLSPQEAQARRTLYEAIGRFVVAFELVVNELRGACRLMLERGGLGIKNQPLANVALARLRISELTDVVGAMYREFRPDDSDGASELSTVLKRVDLLRAKRNTIIHSAWVFGFVDEEQQLDPFSYSIAFDRSRARGQTIRELSYRAEDFDELTREATALQVCGIRLCTSIYQPQHKLSEQLRRPL